MAKLLADEIQASKKKFNDAFDEDYLEPEIENFITFMDDEEQATTGFLSRKRVDKDKEKLFPYLEYLMIYPDMLIDIISPKSRGFKLYPFQRIFIRAMSRGKQTYITASRGTSKSFLADTDRYIKCMNTPRHESTITAGTNKQAAEIAKQKVVSDLWVKFPLFANEMKTRIVAGKRLSAYTMGKDYVDFKFKNGSMLGLGSVRGLRKQSLIFEEVIEQEETSVNEVYIPLLNKPRETNRGVINPYEPQGQQIYITTAGFQGTFAHQKLIETMCRSVLDPLHYYAMCSTYRIPLYHGLTGKQQIEDVLNSPSFSKASFEREYESRWSDAPAGAAFSTNIISALRQVKMVEEKDRRTAAMKEDGVFYVICADMAKDGAAETAYGVAKVIPKEHYFTYKVVKLGTIPSTDYMEVANGFKKLVMTFNARLLIYDANGVGAGIRDWLNKETKDSETGMILGGLGIINPPSSSEHDLIRHPKDKTICYEIKSGGQVGEQIHWFFFSRISTGAITFPIKYAEAISLYEKNKGFMSMGRRKQASFLSSFKEMDKMEQQLKNLDIVSVSDNLSNRLKIARRNQAIQKDYFSMMEYLVYATNQAIENDYYKKHKSKNKIRQIAIID